MLRRTFSFYVTSRVLVMNAKNRIKVVKRAERESNSGNRRQSEAADLKPVENMQNATRSVARQVGAWVKEFHERRLVESGQSFTSLFQRA